MATGKALDGKPYAGNPHVRFDEGEVAPAATPRRGSLLYKNGTAVAVAIAALAAAMPLAGFSAQGRTPKALMVMVDGLRADAVENMPMPTLLMLRDGKWKAGYKGCYSWTAHTLYDARPSSAANHAAIATGVTAKKTGVYNNGETPKGNFAEWPSWLARVKDVQPDVKALFTYTWPGDMGLSPHPGVINVMAPSVGDWPATPGAYDEYGRFVPNILAQADAPDATVCFIGNGDDGGHRSGFYPYGNDYIRNIKAVDRMIGDMLASIAARPSFKDEDWLIMVTSDHGGYGRDHGIWGGHATTIPVVVAGRNVPNGRLAGMPHNYDLAPMALSHFGVDVSGMNLDGRAPDKAVADAARPLRDGLAAYLPFSSAKIDNKAGGKVTATAHGKTVSGVGGGRFGNCLHVEAEWQGACGVSLDGSENLSFENEADFAMTLWVRIDKPQPMQTPIVCNKDWANGANPGVVLIAARTTDAVKVPGVCFNCGLGDERKRLDMGTFDIDYGEWVFYAVTRNSEGILSIYQGGHDGRLYWIAEEAASMKLKTGLPFVIGQSGTQKCKLFFKGDVDDFALWTRALTHEEIRSIYECGQKGRSLGDLM